MTRRAATKRQLASRLTLAALVLPLFVLSVAAPSYVSFRCRFSGMVSLEICCPTGDDAPAHPAFSDESCSDARRRVDVQRSPTGAPDRAASRLQRALVADIGALEPTASRGSRLAPPPLPVAIGPPLSLLTRALLI